MGKISYNQFGTYKVQLGTGEPPRNSDIHTVQNNETVQPLLPAGIEPEKSITEDDLRKLKKEIEDAGGMLPSYLNSDNIFKRTYKDDPEPENTDPNFIEPLLPNLK
jgi:hypothetical protein